VKTDRRDARALAGACWNRSGTATFVEEHPLGFIEYQWNDEADEPAFVGNAEFMPQAD
jgi:hypothetical protein